MKDSPIIFLIVAENIILTIAKESPETPIRVIVGERGQIRTDLSSHSWFDITTLACQQSAAEPSYASMTAQ